MLYDSELAIINDVTFVIVSEYELSVAFYGSRVRGPTPNTNAKSEFYKEARGM